MNKATLKWLLRLALGVGIVALLLARTDTGAFLEAMRGVPNGTGRRNFVPGPWITWSPRPIPAASV